MVCSSLSTGTYSAHFANNVPDVFVVPSAALLIGVSEWETCSHFAFNVNQNMIFSTARCLSLLVLKVPCVAAILPFLHAC